MKKIIVHKKKVPFKKVIVFNKEIETFKDGIEIDFDFIDENLTKFNIFNVVGITHIYENKLKPTQYKIRYQLDINGERIEYEEMPNGV